MRNIRKFRAKIRADILKEIIDIAMSLSIDEAMINVNGGINYILVDPFHVAMIGGDFPKQIFEEYKSDNTNFKFGLDLESTKEFLRNAKTNGDSDTIDIEYIPKRKTSDKIQFAVRNVENTYTTVDTAGMSDPKWPKISFDNYVEVKTKEIQDYLKNNKQISDHFLISWNKDIFTLLMEGETRDSKLRIPKELLISHNISRKKLTSIFSYDYFKSIVDKIKALSVKISWGDNYLVRLEWNVAEKGYVQALIAPRIESD